jgi:nucleoside-diphosphate-sugar epimerase
MSDFGTDLVIVTGAAGWAGSRLVETLAHGLPGDPEFAIPQPNLRIRGLLLPGEEGLVGIPERVEVVSGDLRDPGTCSALCREAKGAVLFHTAGVIHPRRVSDFYDVNVTGTRTLVQAAVAAGVRRLVALSSNSPCGCNPHPDHLFDELSPYHPYMNYGRSKMEMEQVVTSTHRSGTIETVLLRPPWFYGPNQPPRQTLFFRMIRDGKAPVVGSGENLRSMVYVDNLCQGMLLAATVPEANGRTYWIADKRPYSMNEVINTVERLLESEFSRKCVHRRMRLPAVAPSVAFLADLVLQRAGFYHQKVHVLSEISRTIACSIARAEKELGYRPQIELEEGMRRSLAWCVASGMWM